MKQVFHFIALSAALLFASCRVDWDDGGYVRKPAAGRVLEYGTLTPIADAVVSVGCIPGASCGVLDTTRSDADGHYAFPEVENNGLLLVNAFKDGYFTDYMTAKSVLDYSEEQTDIVLPPYAWLQVTIRNESGAYAISSSEISTLSSLQIPIHKDTTFLHLIRGNQEYTYVYSIWSSPNDADTYSLHPFCPGHDTTYVTITF